MRKLGHFIIFLLVFVPVTFLLGKIDFSFLILEQDKDKQELLENSNFSLTHRQVDSKWLEFSLTQSSDSIRLLSNAVIPGEFAAEPDKIWHYAIEYQFLDDNGDIITQQIYHHRSKITWLKDEQGKLQSQTFFLSKDQVPTSSSEILLRTKPYQSISKVRVRTHSTSPEVQFIFFRLYEREVLPDKKIDYLWQRMTLEERERISRFSIFGIDFLREIERYQMLKYRWRPVGPSGILEKNYDTEKLYINKDELIVPIEDKILAAQVDADKDYYHVIPIPEQGGLLSLAFKIIPGGTDSELNNVQINWFGKGRLKREQMTYNLKDSQPWEKYIQGGLVEIRTSQPVAINSWLTNNGQRQEITPDKAVLPVFLLSQNQSLGYRIEHIKERSTPIKISIRRLINEYWLSDKETLINFSFFKQQEKRFTGEIKPEFVRSFYDRILNLSQDGVISEAYNYYLNIPAGVDRIEFESNEPVYINLFNRPPSFYKRIRVPEDYYNPREINHIRPTWFGLQAENQQQLLRNNQRALLSIQPRPPQDEAVVSLDQYEWDDYFPSGNWQARYLFNSRNNDLPVLADSLVSLFHPVPVAETMTLDFIPKAGVSVLEATLIFLRNIDKASKLKVYIDDKLRLETYISGTNGQLKLPAISAGKHKIRIKSEGDTNWFINYSKDQGNYRVKRLSTRIDNKTLNFDFNKNKANMVLSGLFQSRYQTSERSTLQVTITPDKRMMSAQGFSVLNRQFDIRPDNSEAIKVLNTEKQLVGRGQRFFIPLGEDLPLGSYHISMEILDGVPGYISLYTFEFGSAEKYQFFKMNVIDE